MVGTYATAGAKGTYASRADAEPTQFIGLAHLSKYNAQINEGGTYGKDFPYPFRYVLDDSDAVLLRVYLTQPAKGYESFTLTLGLPQPEWDASVNLTAEGYYEAVEGTDFTQVGGFSYSFKPGEIYHDIRVTPVKRTQWFVERLLYVRIEQQNVNGASVLGYANCNLVSIASRLTPPVLTVTGGGAVSGTFNLTFSLDAACIDPVTVYYTWDNTDVVATDSANNSGSLTIASGQSSKVVNFTETTGGGASRTITVDHERGTVVPSKQQTWIDPDAATYSVDRDVHVDENLVRRSNDIGRHGFTSGLVVRTYSASQGFRPQMSGVPTLHLLDGAGELNLNEPNASQGVITIPDNAVTDPITGRQMRYVVPSENVTGIPYIRQEFPAAYGGGPISAFELNRWTRVAYRREFFTGSEASKNVEYSRVGFRIRVRDRNPGVTFKFRKVGTDGWGDQTYASAVFVFDATDHALLDGTDVTLTEVNGVVHKLYFGTGRDIDTSGNVFDTANNFKEAVNLIGGGSKFDAQRQGATVTVTRLEAAPAVGVVGGLSADRSISYNAGTGNLDGYASRPGRFTTASIVDGAGRDMRPTAVGGAGQYYYDSVSGVEVWFWHRYNTWMRPSGYAGSVVSSEDGWNDWYGVIRDEAGLCLWFIHYMPDEVQTGELYRYGTENQTGLSGDTLVNSGNKGLWNYDESSSETSGNKITDTASAYYDLRGYEFSGDIGNPIEYPVWVDSRTNKPDPFPSGGGLYQDGSRSGTNTLDNIRSNERGALMHSWWFETQESQFNSGHPMGPPARFWPSFGNYWTPRGLAITSDPRSTITVTT
jgi:hypothetical protein